MTTQNLIAFFREKQASSPASNVDWENRRREWIAATEGLYRTVTTQWLQGAIQSGLVQVDYRPKQITEDFLGTYETREMVLRVGDEMVAFFPKGRNVVGVSCRIDIKGEMGEIALVVDSDGEVCARPEVFSRDAGRAR